MARASAIERFMAKVDFSGDCYLWKGARNAPGYGSFYDGKGWRAHRWSYETFVGPIGDLCVLHHCDNRACVNPEHLWLGTQLENIRDRDAKGRMARGTTQALAKLTEDDVREIRVAVGNHREVAARYGVSEYVIRSVRSRKGWSHVQ